jgi:hypothetical protein
VRKRKTLRARIEERFARKKGDSVLLTREFSNLGGERQVLRALSGLVRDGKLVCLGYGVYGRAIISRLSGEPLLYSLLAGELSLRPEVVDKDYMLGWLLAGIERKAPAPSGMSARSLFERGCKLPSAWLGTWRLTHSNTCVTCSHA